MKRCIASLLILTFLSTAPVPAQTQSGAIREQEKTEMDTVYEEAWDEPLEWNFDELSTKGYVHTSRVPYAGAIYPDKARGTVYACRKYDQAFHYGRTLAASYEDHDTRAHKAPTGRARGLFGRRGRRIGVPHWSGHCNGWATASIRHAQPTKNVTRNGVVFTPSDIKSLLAEVYTFTDTAFLGGAYDSVINPAALHVSLTNWVGRKDHPIAMERSPGEEIWNFPIYAYNTKSSKRGNHVDVRVTMLYKHYLDREQDEAPKNEMKMYFHYGLTLDDDGNITGGRYYRDSDRIDFLWISRAPTQGGTRGNKLGNPHLKLDRVLALWRASVDEKAMDHWVNVDLKPAPIAEPSDSVAATDETASEASATR
ncbi:MAG: hypothetical protein MI757_02115 [Pirellulales bacterium]|nr:hypothetical protein [Pirellulales bacterium]